MFISVWFVVAGNYPAHADTSQLPAPSIGQTEQKVNNAFGAF
jgi:hypothetical protein